MVGGGGAARHAAQAAGASPIRERAVAHGYSMGVDVTVTPVTPLLTNPLGSDKLTGLFSTYVDPLRVSGTPPPRRTGRA
jgi:hypothetical protein